MESGKIAFHSSLVEIAITAPAAVSGCVIRGLFACSPPSSSSSSSKTTPEDNALLDRGDDDVTKASKTVALIAYAPHTLTVPKISIEVIYWSKTVRNWGEGL